MMMMMMISDRTATIERITKETQIKLTLALDPSTSFENKLVTSVPFLNHMLNTLVCHGGLGIHVEAVGDIDVDPHHLIEDVGIVLGQAIVKALGGSFAGIARAGCFNFPMDGTLASVACGATWFGTFPPLKVLVWVRLTPAYLKNFSKAWWMG
jgi:imidazoleglycerol-phosphate dehydratase